ncbi:TEF transcription factor, PAR bZIP family member b isoform X1 [Megalobrama amblycephala]|uniref:TEF transcription factor, PAR bZIP family member b isoform X1 n=1 Tax=Megalobrama amblycephala TaxID=75352 RepID=UPI002013F95B|nr:TEF transcription factor, PAR bZIP family member b isoform X1 [Megalobrama amblycephala]
MAIMGNIELIMPGQASVTVAIGPQKSSAFVLKKIMNIPPPNILADQDDDIEKEKQGSTGDGTSGGSGASESVSASLTPTIWNKTIPYDGENFHLEYMDLDEFLLENGIPVTLEEELSKGLVPERRGGDSQDSSVTSDEPAAVPQMPEEEQTEGDEDEEDSLSVSDAAEQEVSDETTADSKPDRVTPTPIDPEEIEVNIAFQPDPTDLVLSSVPGGELFNPRKHRFSEDELKPQPMIKKAKKVYVPEDAKDDKYWSRRKKNNVAAKRSRDARRLKENQIAVRASFLERENAALRQEVAELRKDFGRCKKIMSLYEAKYGAL